MIKAEVSYEYALMYHGKILNMLGGCKIEFVESLYYDSSILAVRGKCSFTPISTSSYRCKLLYRGTHAFPMDTAYNRLISSLL